MTDYINNEIIGFTERQITASDYTCKIIETLSFPNISFNKTMKINKFSSLLTDVEMMLETSSIYIIAGYFNGYLMTMLENKLRCFHRPCPDGIKTNTYSWIFDSSSLREKCPNTEFFLVRIQPECGKIRTRKNSVFGHFSHSAYVYIKKSLMKAFFLNAAIENTCFLDHDYRNVIIDYRKTLLIFILFHKTIDDQARKKNLLVS